MLKKLSVKISQIVLFLFVTLYPILSIAKEKEQVAPDVQPPSWSTYMTAYFLVVLCIGLALLVTCSPIRRRDKPLRKD